MPVPVDLELRLLICRVPSQGALGFRGSRPEPSSDGRERFEGFSDPESVEIRQGPSRLRLGWLRCLRIPGRRVIGSSGPFGKELGAVGLRVIGPWSGRKNRRLRPRLAREGERQVTGESWLSFGRSHGSASTARVALQVLAVGSEGLGRPPRLQPFGEIGVSVFGRRVRSTGQAAFLRKHRRIRRLRELARAFVAVLSGAFRGACRQPHPGTWFLGIRSGSERQRSIRNRVRPVVEGLAPGRKIG